MVFHLSLPTDDRSGWYYTDDELVYVTLGVTVFFDMEIKKIYVVRDDGTPPPGALPVPEGSKLEIEI